MNTITFHDIEICYLQCLAVATAKWPVTKWQHQPQGVELSTQKRGYGFATIEGKVQINPAFVGTTAHNKLKATMFHELAHLIVGLSKHHNATFKRIEAILCDGLVVDQSEYILVKNNNGYPLRILAFSQSHVYDCGGAFRRTKKYTEYAPTDKRYHRVGQDRIVRYEYVDFALPLPANTITETDF
ncbi:hypothetical protein [Alteromonas macleodii]|uniref:SprT-like family protein n=1 Tax=Alteromonas macleodii TaxID=28108 RepID=A0AB36FSE5_ALTMA|nr:hypothetical protein [Alteromonas macleodii]OES24681.1 sprT-like family protein [Alteromonas macleodii]OES25784.1 sprT-like family protein [Alteromonas macleodii]OES25865.1 sprT-like family protein [Alteromonas macleodii]OES38966.1 sprT-like family protein [Alteromonas macleodii]